MNILWVVYLNDIYYNKMYTLTYTAEIYNYYEYFTTTTYYIKLYLSSFPPLYLSSYII